MQNKQYTAEFYFSFGKVQLDTAIKLLFDMREKGLPKWVDSYVCVWLDRAVRFLQDDKINMIKDGVDQACYVIKILEMFNGCERWGRISNNFFDLNEYLKTSELKSIYNEKSLSQFYGD